MAFTSFLTGPLSPCSPAPREEDRPCQTAGMCSPQHFAKKRVMIAALRKEAR